MGFWVLAVLLIASIFLTFMLMPKTPEMEDAKRPNFSEFTLPTNSAGRPVPEVFGTVKLSGNFIYAGNFASVAIKEEVDDKK
jgi:hypothetical protein